MKHHTWHRFFGKSVRCSLNNLPQVTNARFVEHRCFLIINPYFKTYARNFQFLRSAFSTYKAKDRLIQRRHGNGDGMPLRGANYLPFEANPAFQKRGEKSPNRTTSSRQPVNADTTPKSKSPTRGALPARPESSSLTEGGRPGPRQPPPPTHRFFPGCNFPVAPADGPAAGNRGGRRRPQPRCALLPRPRSGEGRPAGSAELPGQRCPPGPCPCPRQRLRGGAGGSPAPAAPARRGGCLPRGGKAGGQRRPRQVPGRGGARRGAARHSSAPGPLPVLPPLPARLVPLPASPVPARPPPLLPAVAGPYRERSGVARRHRRRRGERCTPAGYSSAVLAQPPGAARPRPGRGGAGRSGGAARRTSATRCPLPPAPPAAVPPASPPPPRCPSLPGGGGPRRAGASLLPSPPSRPAPGLRGGSARPSLRRLRRAGGGSQR